MNGKLGEILEKINSLDESHEYDEYVFDDEYDEGFIDGVMASFEGEMIDEKDLKIKNIDVDDPIIDYSNQKDPRVGLSDKKPATIAKVIMSRHKTAREAMAAIQFFINRSGTKLSQEKFDRAIAAQEIIAKAFAKKKKGKKKKKK